MGFWRPPGSMEAALAVLDDAATVIDIDPARVYGLGLSNGGLVLSQLGRDHPDRLRGLIYLSPVMPAGIVDQAPFQTNWQGRPVLVITGETDRRIPLDYLHARLASLEQAGVALQTIVYPGEDHFLFFSQKDAVLADIAAWLKTQLAKS
ncbi:MAG: prolyl oligopeptidase family serine peptidase, partial [Anaerolineae bacterium]|nr:prolyl oligopeptidase family serine peptidase [Anaerolineae bacterium]